MTSEEKRQIEKTKGSGNVEEAATALVDAVSGSARGTRARQPAVGVCARRPQRARPAGALGAAGMWAGSGKIPIGVRDNLLVELSRMEKMSVIRKVSHPTSWVNAIVVAAKKDGSLRICLDPRPLNRAIRRAHYPLPTITDIAIKLEGAKYFSKLDARSGFWMVQITEQSADLCTFGTPFGRYQFLRLPYGINCVSEVFHAKIRQLLEDLEGVDSFVDDVIVWGATIEEHDERLKRLLEMARKVGIKFNKEKREFRTRKVTYLGHTFSADGMRVDSKKLCHYGNANTSE
ncbi:uncharacterized protein K02A2.6-like [Hyposmocoma kahamanoa]|uniref:uncharacterized protein K02A2.6-like n=1 Tax=Hyposmocoma kahamanoa TaxID=1477025 RepID=UPI000E6D9437|nr:uncharacterized protein K02A2.6-like [Hyposmocoma kahamanoa]